MPTSTLIEKPKGKVTINDIARECGVSKVTVSYVLNGRERNVKISDRTKERVRAVALELGYHPNALARGLANHRTDMLVLVMQYATVFTGGSAFVTELMHAAMNSASKHGFDLMLQTKLRDTAEDQIAGIVDGRADGALLLRNATDPVAEELLRRGFPTVYVFSPPAKVPVSSIDCDNIAGGRIATEHLISLGHRKIGHLAGKDTAAPARDRKDGYAAAMSAAGLSIDPEWIIQATYAGSDFAKLETVVSGANSPTAFFCWSDDVAAAAMTVLQEKMGLRIPNDISIVGFDSTSFCEHTSPRLTSVRQPFEEICDAAFESIRSLISNSQQEVRTLRFAPKLDERGSCRRL